MSRYVVERRRPEDDERLFDLYAEAFGGAAAEASRRRWTWQYRDNPEASEGPAVWVARNGDERLGQMGTQPVRLQWGGREVRASWGMDFFVRREAEGRGLGPMLARAWTDAVDVALAVGLTPPAHALYKRLGFRDAGAVPFFVAVLDPTAVARRRLGPVPGTLAGPLLGAVLRLRHGSAAAPPAGVELRDTEAIGSEHDALWARAGRTWSLCVRRDAAYLRWRYRDCPHRTYRLIEARRGGELVGVAAFRDEDYRGLRLGWLVDAFAAADDLEAHSALVAGTLARMRAAGVARAQAFATSAPLQAALRGHGFFAERATPVLCVHSAVDPGGAFEARDRWHVVFGDADMDR